MSILVTNIIKWKNNKLNIQEELLLFQDLISSGMAWMLPEHFSRRANYLIKTGQLKDTSGWSS